jgi:predicted nuclease of predicted toxin-antitoxin system
MIKLLLDQGLPRSAASLLRSTGYDAVHTGEIGLQNAVDEVLLERARLEGG